MPLANDLTVGLVTADFTQLFIFRVVLPMAEPVFLRLAMAVPTSPPASAPTVVAPMTFAVRLSPFLRFEFPDVLDTEVLDFISLQTTSVVRTSSQKLRIHP